MTKTNLFQLGDFTLNSGAKSRWKLECEALTGDDWLALAEMTLQVVGPFSHCIGIPRGGLALQACLSPWATEGPCLLVDDVLTTGGSMQKAKAAWEAAHPEIPVIGAVIFARGKCPPWITPLFQMPEKLWIPTGAILDV